MVDPITWARHPNTRYSDEAHIMHNPIHYLYTAKPISLRLYSHNYYTNNNVVGNTESHKDVCPHF